MKLPGAALFTSQVFVLYRRIVWVMRIVLTFYQIHFMPKDFRNDDLFC